MIKYTYEQQQRVDFLAYLKECIDEINGSGNVRMGEQGLMQMRSDLLDLTKNHSHVPVDLSGGKFDLFEKVRLYSDFFLYIIDDEVHKLDPLRNHKLLKKPVSEMTGYEYETFLKLIGKLPSE